MRRGAKKATCTPEVMCKTAGAEPELPELGAERRGADVRRALMVVAFCSPDGRAFEIEESSLCQFAITNNLIDRPSHFS